MKCVSLILFMYYINLILFLICCSLIAEFFLPPSNILPCTYQDLSAIMKEIGMQYKTFHACPNGHIIYYKHHEFETECQECHISRYRTYQIKKKILRKVLYYILIIPCLQQLFECKNIAQFMDYHPYNRSQDNII